MVRVRQNASERAMSIGGRVRYASVLAKEELRTIVDPAIEPSALGAQQVVEAVRRAERQRVPV
jgi:hypothetical protein